MYEQIKKKRLMILCGIKLIVFEVKRTKQNDIRLIIFRVLMAVHLLVDDWLYVFSIFSSCEILKFIFFFKKFFNNV